jgi:hypothetical protein
MMSCRAATIPDAEFDIGALPALAVINPTGSFNSLTYTAVTAGEAGNDITVTYADPNASNYPLSVSVSGKNITVNLRTDYNGRIVSTADEVKAAILASGPASALVDVTSNELGYGYVTAISKTYLSGGKDRQRYYDVVSVTATEGGESGDVFVVNQVPERSVTL